MMGLSPNHFASPQDSLACQAIRRSLSILTLEHVTISFCMRTDGLRLNKTHFLHLKDNPSTVGLDLLRVGCKQLGRWKPEPSSSYWRLFWNDSAGIVLQSDGKLHRLLPNTFYLISPGTSIEANIESTVSKHFYVHFVLRNESNHARNGIYVLEPPNRLALFLEKLISLGEQDYLLSSSDNYEISSIVTELLARLPEGCWEPICKDMTILKVIGYMRENYADDISNASLAGIACLARNSFIRKFTDIMGISPQKYLEQVRMDNAKILLKYSSKTIDEIAAECGFSDRYYFSSRFKKVVDIPPARYRKTY